MTDRNLALCDLTIDREWIVGCRHQWFLKPGTRFLVLRCRHCHGESTKRSNIKSLPPGARWSWS